MRNGGSVQNASPRDCLGHLASTARSGRHLTSREVTSIFVWRCDLRTLIYFVNGSSWPQKPTVQLGSVIVGGERGVFRLDVLLGIVRLRSIYPPKRPSRGYYSTVHGDLQKRH